jgi:N-acetylmuramoyl-L-alanine amidase
VLTIKPFVLFSIVTLLSFPVFSQTSVKTVIAEKGDGIYSILRKQGINPIRHYGHFVDLNQDNLRDSVHLYEGREYIIPIVPVDTIAIEESVEKKTTEIKVVSNIMTDDIFGKSYAITEIKSNKLQGNVYYLISGHGGPDPGAVEEYEGKIIAEDEYAYDITLRLAKELISHGAKTYIIIRDLNDGIRDQRVLEIDRDEVAYPNDEIPLNQLLRLKQRVDAVNKLYLENIGKYQRLIVTHVDSRSRGQNIDVFFYHHENSKNGKRLAESIHETFLKKYKQYQPNRDYEGTFGDRSGLYLVKNTMPAMAYIEVGNIKNKKDQKRILEPDNRQALAKWISEGVLLDYETRK